MAKAKFTYACGHQGSVMERNRSQADRKAAWYAGKTCWECEKAAENAAAAEAAAAAGLPDLQGTPKQVVFGTTRRAQKIDHFRAAIAKLRTSVAGSTRHSAAAIVEIQDALMLLESEVLAETSASFWIEFEGYDERNVSIWALKAIRARGLASSAMADA